MIIVPILHGLFSSFRTRMELQLEVAALRHQVEVLRRDQRSRVRLTRLDRALWVLLYRLWSRCLDAVVIVKPETVVRWHRLGFRAFWSWKSRPRGPGRPSVPSDIKNLIKRISRDNVLWGAPRIHGELLKLGIEISQAAVSKYMIHRSKPPSPTGAPSCETIWNAWHRLTSSSCQPRRSGSCSCSLSCSISAAASCTSALP